MAKRADLPNPQADSNEVKNVTKWSGAYVKQARHSLGVLGASQAVLVSTAFPGKHKHLAFEKGVAIVHPSIVGKVVHALRQVIVVRAAASGGQADRERRADQLLKFIKGNEFARSTGTISEGIRDLAALQAKERRQHDLVWEAQSEMYRSVERSHTMLESRIANIAGGHPLALVRDGELGALPAE